MYNRINALGGCLSVEHKDNFYPDEISQDILRLYTPGEPVYDYHEGPMSAEMAEAIRNLEGVDTALIMTRHTSKADMDAPFTAIDKNPETGEDDIDLQKLRQRIDPATGLESDMTGLFQWRKKELKAKFHAKARENGYYDRFIEQRSSQIASIVASQQADIIKSFETLVIKPIREQLKGGQEDFAKIASQIKEIIPTIKPIIMRNLGPDVEADSTTKLLGTLVEEIIKSLAKYSTADMDISTQFVNLVTELGKYDPTKPPTNELLISVINQTIDKEFEEDIDQEAEEVAYIVTLGQRNNEFPYIYPQGRPELVAYHKLLASLTRMMNEREDKKSKNVPIPPEIDDQVVANIRARLLEIKYNMIKAPNATDDRMSEIPSKAFHEARSLGMIYLQEFRDQAPKKTVFIPWSSNVQRAKEAAKIMGIVFKENLIPVERRVDKATFRKVRSVIYAQLMDSTLTPAQRILAPSILVKLQGGIDWIAGDDITEFNERELKLFPMLAERSAIFWDENFLVLDNNFLQHEGLKGSIDSIVTDESPDFHGTGFSLAELMDDRKTAFIGNVKTKDLSCEGFSEAGYRALSDYYKSIGDPDPELAIYKAMMDKIRFNNGQTAEEIMGITQKEYAQRYDLWKEEVREKRHKGTLRDKPVMIIAVSHSPMLDLVAPGRLSVDPDHYPAGRYETSSKDYDALVQAPGRQPKTSRFLEPLITVVHHPSGSLDNEEEETEVTSYRGRTSLPTRRASVVAKRYRESRTRRRPK